MTQGRRTILVFCLLATLAADVFAAVKEPPIGKSAPDFHVTTYDGTKLSLADFKGQVLVVNFWATWCTPCKAELPMLDAYYRAQQRVLRYAKAGAWTLDDLNDILVPLLREEAPAT